MKQIAATLVTLLTFSLLILSFASTEYSKVWGAFESQGEVGNDCPKQNEDDEEDAGCMSPNGGQLNDCEYKGCVTPEWVAIWPPLIGYWTGDCGTGKVYANEAVPLYYQQGMGSERFVQKSKNCWWTVYCVEETVDVTKNCHIQEALNAGYCEDPAPGIDAVGCSTCVSTTNPLAGDFSTTPEFTKKPCPKIQEEDPNPLPL